MRWITFGYKLLGSHLRFERDEDKWMSILESNLWDLDPATNEIFPTLKLSYQRMSIHFKPCFRYCSIFPKNNIPDKTHLVWLWMAQGYMQPKIRGKTTEIVERILTNSWGDHPFKQQNIETILRCMTWFMIWQFLFLTMTVHDEPINNEALKDILVFPFLSRHVALRSIFCYGRRIINDFQLLDSIRLRVLHIQIDYFDPNLSNFLGSISSMKPLRYLYLHAYAWSGPHLEKFALSSLFNSLLSIGNV
ncbi:hypothetical protein M5K25_001052 [Dendrobium thyrsiflorum]|uniref:Disease resistance protein winged helix domain-containing protein n=1 Tax=Dendrobium thyrsiflorum TaxID=117978 RepID=A0ABD0VVW5_DENTH